MGTEERTVGNVDNSERGTFASGSEKTQEERAWFTFSPRIAKLEPPKGIGELAQLKEAKTLVEPGRQGS